MRTSTDAEVISIARTEKDDEDGEIGDESVDVNESVNERDAVDEGKESGSEAGV
jgi:hypothetical protein